LTANVCCNITFIDITFILKVLSAASVVISTSVYVAVHQAQARCHRIGQQKAVKVYRLITRNTYEREMFDRASLKLGLDKAVLQSMGPKDLTAVRPLCFL